MRCPSCGTENAPDSRFCGGCGARMPAEHSRVAPTQKMSDEAQYRPTGSEAVGPQSIPPQNSRHVSHPPQMPAPASDVRAVTRPGPGTPANSTPPARADRGLSSSPTEPPTGHDRQRTRPPRASSFGVTPAAGSSLPGRAQTPGDSLAPAPPSRRLGLILLVLLIDLGLAASGAWMLSQGLAH